MANYTWEDCIRYLQQMVGQPLSYGWKSWDMDIFDVEFGDLVTCTNLYGETHKCHLHIMHSVGAIKIIWWKEKRSIFYDIDTTTEEFYSDIQKLIGLEVLRVALSDKNDLWFDFGDIWMVFITYDSNEESWRYFTARSEDPHLVAADSWLQLVYDDDKIYTISNEKHKTD